MHQSQSCDSTNNSLRKQASHGKGITLEDITLKAIRQKDIMIDGRKNAIL